MTRRSLIGGMKQKRTASSRNRSITPIRLTYSMLLPPIARIANMGASLAKLALEVKKI
ncbi:hypothetical protein TRIP_B360034 [uncultured Desulfatiglans sp.]|nr:hypothetical protein TRIP_B360034 [uncultured Desulfatiglans sp.]